MKLSQFSALLEAHPDKPFHLVLPGDNVVPASFHITEVGHVTKKFIDCGGKLHSAQRCQLQVWLGGDTEPKEFACRRFPWQAEQRQAAGAALTAAERQAAVPTLPVLAPLRAD